MRKYHTLLLKEEGQWTIDLGSYEMSDIEFEKDEYRNRGVKVKDMRIITTGPQQSSIQAEVDRLNAAWRTEA